MTLRFRATEKPPSRILANYYLLHFNVADEVGTLLTIIKVGAIQADEYVLHFLPPQSRVSLCYNF